MSDVSPEQVLREVARAVPHDFLENIVVIGSLAAGYHFFRDEPSLQVRTKDFDCILRPRLVAVEAGVAIANQLIQMGWTPRKEEPFTEPGTSITPDSELPAVRLYPPGSVSWFIELLTVPRSEVELESGHYGLPCFRFLSIAAYNPVKTEFGLYCARPEMMALANLLEHPVIGEQTMSGLFAGQRIKRSNKDLGRVIALARLSNDETEAWPAVWEDALRACFPTMWRELALCAGNGLRALLNSQVDFSEAFITCTNGLLAHYGVTEDQLQVTGQRLLQDAILPLERAAEMDRQR
jgi:hypothetical protein